MYTNFDEGEIEKLYQEIKAKILEPNVLNISQIELLIQRCINYKNKYRSSYQFLIDKIYERNTYSVKKYHEIYLNEYTACERAIIEDDIHSFIVMATMEESVIFKQVRGKNIYLDIVPRDPLLEWCCKYGAVKCFKYLITEFNLEITSRCLQLSFLGGNADIGCPKVRLAQRSI